MSCQLTGSVIARIDLTDIIREQLYQLFFRYYQRVDRTTFDLDLDEKDWVLLLRDSSGEIQGFTTMMLFDFTFDGHRVRAIFSGNTIIEKAFWGDRALMKTWGHFMTQRKCEMPDVPLYWYLISSGYRTYLFLPFFYKDFYPRFDKPTPDYEKRLIDTLGQLKFPQEYEDGIVHVSSPRECLNPEIAIPEERRLKNPHVQFFVNRNPKYLSGNELVCITEFSLDNNCRMARTALLDGMSAQERISALKVGETC